MADTQDTQDVAGDTEEASTLDAKIWGKLLPLDPRFDLIDLVKDSYLFGRNKAQCDFLYDGPQISNKHCMVYKKIADDESITAFIEDLSSNGTFVNGIKIGKGKTVVLNNNDEVSFALKKNKVFMYHDQQASSGELLNDTYYVTKLLGAGNFAEVKLGISKHSGERFAIKILNKKKFVMQPAMRDSMLDEVNILKEVSHPCIISVHDMVETDTNLYIVLEYVTGGELFDHIVKVQRFAEKPCKFLFYQMCRAVEYLHDRGITHRDLKPENVLVSATQGDWVTVKISDFGLAKIVGEQSFMQTLCGTPSYLAPEVLTRAGKEGYSSRVDCWSLGVILYICLCGYPPFSDEITKYPLFEQITKGIFTFPKDPWALIDENAKDLVNKLLVVDPTQRLSIKQVLSHPWMKDSEIINRGQDMLNLSPPIFVESETTPKRGLKRAAADETGTKTKQQKT
eukprot:Colp12_sorted_trinity150504_noHs@10962